MNSHRKHICARSVATIALFAALQSAMLAQQNPDAQHRKLQDQTAQGFVIPKFELAGKLSKIFTVSRCEYISGLTCHIHYNGKLPLPSEVFFTEFDEHGKKAGPRVRLIYPKLNSGETGVATFRIRLSTPAKIVLEGEWNGPWRDPY
ncbi:MAG TPA: hypothetical protein VNK23_15330 [Candidatus Dormibacteraeota bacterium]|nr:hypothetical protein [Candidatus Dormibacteraeota bacterium]